MLPDGGGAKPQRRKGVRALIRLKHTIRQTALVDLVNAQQWNVPEGLFVTQLTMGPEMAESVASPPASRGEGEWLVCAVSAHRGAPQISTHDARLRLVNATCADIDDLAAQQHRDPEIDDKV
jgi:hypothetical protein